MCTDIYPLARVGVQRPGPALGFGLACQTRRCAEPVRALQYPGLYSWFHGEWRGAQQWWRSHEQSVCVFQQVLVEAFPRYDLNRQPLGHHGSWVLHPGQAWKKDALKSLLGELIKCFPSQAFQFLPALELLCKTGFDHLLLQTDVWG